MKPQLCATLFVNSPSPFLNPFECGNHFPGHLSFSQILLILLTALLNCSQVFHPFPPQLNSSHLFAARLNSCHLFPALLNSSLLFSCSHLFFTPSHMFSILRNSPQLISPLLNSFLTFLHTFFSPLLNSCHLLSTLPIFTNLEIVGGSRKLQLKNRVRRQSDKSAKQLFKGLVKRK